MRVNPRLLLASALTVAFVGCGVAGTSQNSASQHASSRITRPTNLAPGTRVYRPEVVMVEAPGENFVVAPGAVLKSTPTTITIDTPTGPRTFSLATTKVTYDAQVQELYVPPGHDAPKGAGRLVDIIR